MVVIRTISMVIIIRYKSDNNDDVYNDNDNNDIVINDDNDKISGDDTENGDNDFYESRNNRIQNDKTKLVIIKIMVSEIIVAKTATMIVFYFSFLTLIIAPII